MSALPRPDLPAGDRWVFNDLEAQWNKNLILNIAAAAREAAGGEGARVRVRLKSRGLARRQSGDG